MCYYNGGTIALLLVKRWLHTQRYIPLNNESERLSLQVYPLIWSTSCLAPWPTLNLPLPVQAKQLTYTTDQHVGAVLISWNR